MKTFMVIVALGILAITVIFMDGSPYVDSDGWGYYHTAKSLVEEGNFVASKSPGYFEYAAYRVVHHQNQFVSKYAPGYPLIAFPALLVSSFFDQGSTYSDYFKAYNGHSIWDGLALLLLNVILTILSFFFVYKTLEIFQISQLAKLFSSGIPFLVSFYYTYALEEIGFSHPAEVFAISGVLFFTLKSIYSNQKIAGKLRFCALWSLFFGLAVLVRPTNAIILLPWLVFYILSLFHTFSKPVFLKSLFLIGLIGSTLLAVYLYYNWSSYGDPLTNGYTAFSQGDFSFTKYFFLSHLLFSGCRGWFVYSPAVIFSILGLVLMGVVLRSKDDSISGLKRNFCLFSLASICLNALTYSFWHGWWAGNSAGQRYFILLIPFLAIGFAGWWSYLNRSKKWLRISLLSLLATLVLYSLTLTVLLRVSSVPVMARIIEIKKLHPEVPRTEEFTVLDVFRYHYTLIHTSKSFPKYLNKLMAGYKNGRSIFALFTNLSEPIVKIQPVGDRTWKLHIHPRPNGQPANSDLIISIKSKQFSNTYRISGIDFTAYGVIKIQCDESRCAFTSTGSIAPKIKRLESGEPSVKNFIRINNGTSIGLTYTGDRIKFPDYRIKISHK